MASRRQLSFTEEEEPEGQLLYALCRHHHSHISKVSTWKRTQDKEFLADYGVNEDDFVCRPCRDDVRRLVRSQGPTQIPRWEKKKKEVRCCVKLNDTLHTQFKRLLLQLQVVFEATISKQREINPFSHARKFVPATIILYIMHNVLTWQTVPFVGFVSSMFQGHVQMQTHYRA